MEKRRLYALLLVSIVISLSLLGAYQYAHREQYVLLSTTTSVDNTGLLDYINAYLEENYKLSLRRTAVGTGMALLIASRGDVDACIVHAPSLEHSYRLKGYFLERKVIAYNFFILVGPEADPANVSSSHTILEAFYKIYLYGEEHHEKIFVSRGDNSGTHVKEKTLRNEMIKKYKLNVTYEEISQRPRYVSSGSGMSDTLMMASEYRAYTLSDIGTFLVMKKNASIDLKKLYAGDNYTINVYSIMVVKNAEHLDKAKRLADFLASQGQALIAKYGVDEFGFPLFYPARPLLEAYKNHTLKPGSQEYVPPDLRRLGIDDLTLAQRIFNYAFWDVDGDGQIDRSSGW